MAANETGLHINEDKANIMHALNPNLKTRFRPRISIYYYSFEVFKNFEY